MSVTGGERPFSKEVEEFILREVDSVPHLEALLQLWNSRPRQWSADEMAAVLYVKGGEARKILHGLVRRRLVDSGEGELYCYRSDGPDHDAVVGAVDAAYRRYIVLISRMIHAKASPGVRDFADAFRFTKDKE